MELTAQRRSNLGAALVALRIKQDEPEYAASIDAAARTGTSLAAGRPRESARARILVVDDVPGTCSRSC